MSESRTNLGAAAALITGARSFQMAAVFVLGVLLALSLDEDHYATYMHVTTLAAILPIAVGVPVGKAITYFLPRAGAKTLLLRRLAAVLSLTGLGVAAVVAFQPQVLRAFDQDPDLVANGAVVGVILGLSFPYIVAEYTMLARRRRRAYSLLLLGVSTLLVLGVGGGLVLAPRGEELAWALRGLVPAYALQAGAALFWLLRPVEDDPPQGDVPRGILAFALPLAFATLVSAVATQLDRLLIPWLYPKELFPGVKALYFRGAMDVPVIGAVAFTVLALIAPDIATHHAAGDRAGLLALWRRASRMVAILSVPVVGLLMVVAHEIVPMVYGQAYAGSVPVFQWYTTLLVLRVFLPQVLLEYTGAPGMSLWCAGATLGLGLAASAILIPAFGWVGAAAAMVFANFAANWGVAGAFARRHLAVRWRDLCDWESLARVLAASTVAAAATAGLRATGVFDGLPGPAVHGVPFLRVSLLCATYAAAFLLVAPPLRALTLEDVTTLRRIVTFRRSG